MYGCKLALVPDEPVVDTEIFADALSVKSRVPVFDEA
jgi:hypothetical protein